ncbi:alpha-hydroxy-acid oxidizing protein [Pseudonocardia sp. RS11V-5]|nr:alpha-hydroxy-acid oxidizing protein [Pseudonocardia terrae]
MVSSFVDGGAEGLRTVAANRAAFDDWQLVPRLLVGHDTPRLGVTVAGTPLALPVLLAPTGFTGLSRWSGDRDAVRAAERCGTRYCVSTAASWTLEEIAEAGTTDHVFQLYPTGTAGLSAELLRRARNAGYRTLMVTADVPVMGNREGERREGMGIPPVLTPRRLLDVARHPRWAAAVVRHRRVGGRNMVDEGGVAAAVRAAELQERAVMQAELSWDDLAWMRDGWPGRMYLKGVLRAEDASRAVDLGCDGVVVSNHGGRQLDGAPPSLAVLPEVVGEVGDRAEVLFDGGIRRGSDVVTALALGADAVLIGRPYVHGLAVAGQRGVEHVLEILREEITRTLVLLGVAGVADLDRSHLRPATGGHASTDRVPAY